MFMRLIYYHFYSNEEGHATSEWRSRSRDETEAEKRLELRAGKEGSRTPAERNAETWDQTRDSRSTPMGTVRGENLAPILPLTRAAQVRYCIRRACENTAYSNTLFTLLLLRLALLFSVTLMEIDFDE